MGRGTLTAGERRGEGAEGWGGGGLAAGVATAVPVEEQTVDGVGFRLECGEEDGGEGAVIVVACRGDPEAGEERGGEGRLEAIGPGEEKIGRASCRERVSVLV